MALDGRNGLVEVIHPPIDSGLWKGIAQQKDYGSVRELIHPLENGRRIRTINALTRYDSYSKIIEGCRQMANDRGWRLIEIEAFWRRQ